MHEVKIPNSPICQNPKFPISYSENTSSNARERLHGVSLLAPCAQSALELSRRRGSKSWSQVVCGCALVILVDCRACTPRRPSSRLRRLRVVLADGSASSSFSLAIRHTCCPPRWVSSSFSLAICNACCPSSLARMDRCNSSFQDSAGGNGIAILLYLTDEKRTLFSGGFSVFLLEP